MQTQGRRRTTAPRRPLLRRLALPLLLGAAVAGLLVARVLLGTPFVFADLAVRAVLGEQIPGVSFIVMDDRLPAAVVGALAGAALGLSGTVFQTLLRNPLASPDVIGVTLGSSAAAVLAMALVDAQGMALFWWTLAGGLGTALLVLWVARAHRRGGPGAGGAGAVDDRFVLDPDRLYLDTPAMQLVGRLHGSGWFTRASGDMFRMERPTGFSDPAP